MRAVLSRRKTRDSASGLGKRTGSNPGTAPQADSTTDSLAVVTAIGILDSLVQTSAGNQPRRRSRTLQTAETASIGQL